MKFAMNGALTVGTLDGANIEIREAVGTDNIFVFGLTASAIGQMRTERSYSPREYYANQPALRRVLDALASDLFCPREPDLFRLIADNLLDRDDYFVAADFASYLDTQQLIAGEYVQPALWARKAILNVARIGRFSSDRTVAEYAREIWHLTARAETAKL
jgi:starch phosphorylase